VGEHTKISWTNHTFNSWWVCTKVSPGCDHCYAEAWARRMGYEWGKTAPRRFFGKKHWNEPLRWNEKAKREGVRQRVLCGSMCDVLDTWRGTPIFPDSMRDWETWKLIVGGDGWLGVARYRLWQLIDNTRSLDWLLLTKRPENYKSMLPRHWFNRNMWIGTTVESPEYLWRAKAIATVPAVVHFISWEPGLAYVDFRQVCADRAKNWWVIGGGESGPDCRPFDLHAARRVRNDCREVGARFFLKQLGGHPDKQDDPTAWPNDLRIQEFPQVIVHQNVDKLSEI
jgi:protein gp37